MILILTDKFDKHTDRVIEKLELNNENYFRLNLDVESLKKVKISYDNENWILKKHNNILNLNNVSVVWARRAFVELTLQEKSSQDIDLKIWKNEWNKTLLGLYLELNHLPWLNPLRKAYKAENKYLQMKVAKEVGLKMPETFISNEKSKLIEFMKNKDVVLKLMSQEFYKDNDKFKGFYVNKVNKDDFESFNEYSENPIVLQK